MLQHRRRGTRVLERVVGTAVGHVVTQAEIVEAVRGGAVGIEPARQPQRAELLDGRQGDPLTAGGAGDERPVERRVVGREHGALETIGELADDVPAVGCGTQRAPVDPVHGTGADPLPGPTQAHQRRPLVDDRAVLDRDDRHLQDPVAAQGEAGRLDVDNREPRENELGGPTGPAWSGRPRSP